MSAANVKNPPVHCPSVPSRRERRTSAVSLPLSHLFARPPKAMVTDGLARLTPPFPSTSEDRPVSLFDPVL